MAKMGFSSRRPLGLRPRLLLLVALPCAITAGLIADRAFEQRASAREADDLALLVRLAVRIGDLLHETQRERGSSSVFMSSNGTKFSRELEEQREATNARMLAYLEFVRRND